MSHGEEVRMDKLSDPVRTEGSGEQMSESLVEKWRKIPLGAGAVVAGMCADELAARDAKIRKLVEPMKCRGVHCNDVECTFHHGVTTCIRCRILALLDGQPEASTQEKENTHGR